MYVLRSIFIVGLLVFVVGIPLGGPSFLLAKEDSAESGAGPENGGEEAEGDLPQVFIQETRHVVGEIRRGKTVLKEFVIENRGKSPLEITTRASCGCTVVDYDKVIPPGSQGAIKVVLRTSGLSGEFRKFVDVQTNDPANRRFQLVLSGRIVEPVEVVPRQIPVVGLKLGEPTELKLSLRTMENVAVTGVRSNASYVQARIEPEGDRTHQLHITVGPDAPLGRSNFVVTLTTNDKDASSIPVTVFCEKGIMAFPSSFVLSGNARGPGDSVRSIVLLRKREGEFHVRRIVSSDPNLRVEAVAIKDGSIYQLTAKYQGDVSNLSATGVVTVETGDPQEPKLEIPIRSTPRSRELSCDGK